MSFWLQLLSGGGSQPGKCLYKLRCLSLSAWDVAEPLLRAAPCISCWVLPQACSQLTWDIPAWTLLLLSIPTGVPRPAVLQEGMLTWVILLILLTGCPKTLPLFSMVPKCTAPSCRLLACPLPPDLPLAELPVTKRDRHIYCGCPGRGQHWSLPVCKLWIFSMFIPWGGCFVGLLTK